MQDKKQSKDKSDIEFDIDMAKAFFLGAFDILKITKDLMQIRVDSKESAYILGTVACHVIILGHTIELLLKTRIQAEGGKIEPIHNLHTLFTSLKDDSITRVEKIYKTVESVKLPNEKQRYGSIGFFT